MRGVRPAHGTCVRPERLALLPCAARAGRWNLSRMTRRLDIADLTNAAVTQRRPHYPAKERDDAARAGPGPPLRCAGCAMARRRNGRRRAGQQEAAARTCLPGARGPECATAGLGSNLCASLPRRQAALGTPAGATGPPDAPGASAAQHARARPRVHPAATPASGEPRSPRSVAPGRGTPAGRRPPGRHDAGGAAGHAGGRQGASRVWPGGRKQT